MHQVIIPILGFRQKSKRITGIERLWRELRGFSTPERCVYKPLLWDSDWKGEAALLQRNLAPDPLVIVIAYSWGAGWGCMKLAEALGDLKDEKGRPAPINVWTAVLADPVYRRPWVPAFIPFNPTSMSRFPRISVPANVRYVYWTRQRKNRPCGHTLYESGDNTWIWDCVELDLPHEHMDDAPEFHAMALDAVRQFI